MPSAFSLRQRHRTRLISSSSEEWSPVHSSVLPPSLPAGVKRPFSSPLPCGALLQNMALLGVHACAVEQLCSHTQALQHLSEGSEGYKMHQMFVFHLQEWLHALVLPCRWKGLGQQESMAQKTPRVLAPQWQITVASPKRRRLKGCFLTSLKRDLAVEGSEKTMLVAAGHYCHAPLRPLLSCKAADTPTCGNLPGEPKCTDTLWARTLTHTMWKCLRWSLQKNKKTNKNTLTKRNHFNCWTQSSKCSLAMLVLNTWE